MTKTMLKVFHTVLIALACAATEVFLVLCLLPFREAWGETWFWLAILGGSLFDLALFVTDLVCYFLGKQVIYKACITVYVMAVVFAALLYALIATGFFDVLRDQKRLEEYLERSGKWMGAVFVLLQFLQVVILPIPSTVTVVAGAVLFGPLVGSLLSLLGIVLGSLVGFLIGRYAGTRVGYWLIGKENLEKWLNKIKGKDKLLLTAMFLLPVFPDDVLCFVAGMSSMSLIYFLAVIVISRILAIFTTSYSISLIPFDTWWGLLIWGILGVLIVILFVVLYKKSDAILGWFEKKFRPSRVKEERKKGEFSVDVVSPDGDLVTKSVPKEGEAPPLKGDENSE